MAAAAADISGEHIPGFADASLRFISLLFCLSLI